jgi:hypothetical protein
MEFKTNLEKNAAFYRRLNAIFPKARGKIEEHAYCRKCKLFTPVKNIGSDGVCVDCKNGKNRDICQ